MLETVGQLVECGLDLGIFSVQVSSSVIIIMHAQSDLTYPHTSVIDEIADKVRERTG